MFDRSFSNLSKNLPQLFFTHHPGQQGRVVPWHQAAVVNPSLVANCAVFRRFEATETGTINHEQVNVTTAIRREAEYRDFVPVPTNKMASRQHCILQREGVRTKYLQCLVSRASVPSSI